MSEMYPVVEEYFMWLNGMVSTYRRILDMPRCSYLMDICLDEFVEGMRFSMTDSQFEEFRAQLIYGHDIMLVVQSEEFEEYYRIRHILEGGLDMPLPAHLEGITDLKPIFFESLNEAFFPRRLDRVVSPVKRGGFRDVFEDPPQPLE